jgi:Ca2+-binding RTX toxin-like protein
VKANPLEKDPEYLVGLEYSPGEPLVALSHRGNLFSGVVPLGDLGNPRNFATTLGGLGLAPFGVIPDSTRDDFVIGITGDEKATVGFGNEPTGRELLDGDDFLDGGCEDVRDELYGDDGTDLPRGVVSVGGKDEIRGRGGDDLLDGGLLGDVILGGDGNDTIRGGTTGLNRLEGNAGTDRIDGGAGTDFAYGHDGEDTIRGFAGGDLLFGGADPDDLDGGDGADLLVPGSGGDTKGDKAAGGAGDDTIVVIDVTRGGEFAVVPTGTAKDLYDGGAGTDTLLLDADLASVALNDTTLLAYRFDDAVGFEIAILAGGASDNVILAGTFSGRTVIRGRGGRDTLVGGTAADWIDGGDGDDSLTGNAGDDTLLPGTGTNQVVGGADDDTYILAATGTNTIVEAAGGGTDSVDMSAVGTARLFVRIGSAADGTAIQTSGATLVATFANDGIEAVLLGGGDDEIVLRDGTISVAAIDAAAGSDTLAYTDPRGGWGAWAAGVTVDLGDGTATSLAGIDGVENVIGGSGGDSLSGDDVANRLDGEAGIDTLVGRGGDDDLHGGADNDILVGNAGRDTLQGGGGTNALAGNEDDDVYRFAEDGHIDTVVELAGQGFDQLLFTTGTRGITFDVGARIVADDGVGRVTVLLAAGIDRVVGTSLTDTFRIADGATFPGRLDGGGIPGASFADLDALDYSDWTSGVVVDYTGGLDATFVGAATGTGGIVNLRHVIGGTRDDRLVAGGLPVWFEGGDGSDRLEGSPQDDRLDGGVGADTLLGGFGADRLAGGAGLDTLRGGAGDDRYLFADLFGVDTVHESPLEGRDTMDFAAVTVPLVVRLGSVTATTGAGDLAIHAGSAIEEVVGGGAADAFEMTGPAVTFPGTLDGGGGANSLTYFDATAEIIAAVAGGGTPNVESARNFATIQAVNNDFTPVFGGGFTGAITENAPVTTVAYTAVATDADASPGNVLTYSLVPALGDDADLMPRAVRCG